jgi:hypothetical protein
MTILLERYLPIEEDFGKSSSIKQIFWKKNRKTSCREQFFWIKAQLFRKTYPI